MEAGGVRQTEMHATDPFVTEFEVAIGKLKRYKSSGVDHISAELTKTGR
jgi:hypothetical protein